MSTIYQRRWAVLVGLGILFIVLLNAGAIPTSLPTIKPIFPTPLSPRIANYNIAVNLDVVHKRLDGQEVLVWHNRSSDAITELQFHLYLNAFRNNQSTFMKESGGQHRGNKIDEKKGWGFIDITRMVWLSNPRGITGVAALHLAEDTVFARTTPIDLTSDIEFIQPDDGNPDDKTVIRVPLPRPLAPGDSIMLRIDFVAKLPEPPFARTGALEEFFMVGQWFPKIGVYTPQGWNCHQFHLNSEFFADFGVYNVWITLPKAYIVGATGLEYSVTENPDGTATHFYHAEDVHDFAWTASTKFVEIKGQEQDVTIRVLMQPDHVNQGQRQLEAAKVAVRYFQNWYGDYPFPNLTVVDPRTGARGAGGMEYPTLITTGTSYNLSPKARFLEMVTIHEFGHNYWYHLLASNEFEESWMDEGINSYTEVQIMADAYGKEANMLDVLGLRVSDLQLQRLGYLRAPKLDPMLRKAWEYYDNQSYGINSYSRPAVLLTTLQNYLGVERMRKGMQEYVKRFRFKHPTSQDFVRTLSEAVGEDLSWFFNQALYSNAALDYGIGEVKTYPVPVPTGFDYTLNVSDFLHNKDLEPTEVEPQDTLYYSEVKVRRFEEFIFPVEIEMVFENGDTVREYWDGRGYWKKFTYLKPSPLMYATVDPDFKIPMDINVTNNSKTVKLQRKGLNKLSIRSLFAAQFTLEQASLFNLFQLLLPF